MNSEGKQGSFTHLRSRNKKQRASIRLHVSVNKREVENVPSEIKTAVTTLDNIALQRQERICIWKKYIVIFKKKGI